MGREAGILNVDPVRIPQIGKDTNETATVIVGLEGSIGGGIGRTTPKLVALITPYKEHHALSSSYSGAAPAWRYRAKPSSIIFSPAYSPRRQAFLMRSIT